MVVRVVVVRVGGRYVMYGRLSMDMYPDDVVWEWSMATNTWTHIDLPSTAVQPITRSGHASANIMVPVERSSTGESELVSLLFGGECQLSLSLGLPFKDAWLLSPTQSSSASAASSAASPSVQWTLLDVLVYPTLRLRHTATMVGNQMCMFGGLDVTYGFQDSLWCLSYGVYNGKRAPRAHTSSTPAASPPARSCPDARTRTA